MNQSPPSTPAIKGSFKGGGHNALDRQPYTVQLRGAGDPQCYQKLWEIRASPLIAHVFTELPTYSETQLTRAMEWTDRAKNR